MAQFQVEVVETRNYSCLYKIEAENSDVAMKMALIGETIEEKELTLDGVMDRHPDLSTLKKVI